MVNTTRSSLSHAKFFYFVVSHRVFMTKQPFLHFLCDIMSQCPSYKKRYGRTESNRRATLTEVVALFDPIRNDQYHIDREFFLKNCRSKESKFPFGEKTPHLYSARRCRSIATNTQTNHLRNSWFGRVCREANILSERKKHSDYCGEIFSRQIWKTFRVCPSIYFLSILSLSLPLFVTAIQCYQP